jgi:hypothetical protein
MAVISTVLTHGRHEGPVLERETPDSYGLEDFGQLFILGENGLWKKEVRYWALQLFMQADRSYRRKGGAYRWFLVREVLVGVGIASVEERHCDNGSAARGVKLGEEMGGKLGKACGYLSEQHICILSPSWLCQNDERLRDKQH